MQITTRRYADAVVAMPAGRIDHLSAPQFEGGMTPLLAPAGAGPLVIDFSAVDYISSAGLRVLMIASTQMKSQQRKLAVCSLQPVVAEIFSISRFDRVLTVKPALGDALEFCSAEALAAYRQAGGAVGST